MTKSDICWRLNPSSLSRTRYVSRSLARMLAVVIGLRLREVALGVLQGERDRLMRSWERASR
jgi:hypothetical protein